MIKYTRRQKSKRRKYKKTKIKPSRKTSSRKSNKRQRKHLKSRKARGLSSSKGSRSPKKSIVASCGAIPKIIAQYKELSNDLITLSDNFCSPNNISQKNIDKFQLNCAGLLVQIMRNLGTFKTAVYKL